MIISAFGASRQGTRRENNQDRFLIDNELHLFILCNGMGGHKAGDIAARVAADSAQSYIQAHFPELTHLHGKSLESAARHIVQEAIQSACNALYQHGQNVPECRGMGTSLSLALIHENRVYLGHVGDSRVGLLRAGRFEQLSRDHTLIQELIDQGALSPQARHTSPYKHVLSRFLGSQESVQVDILHLDLLPEDRLLLATSPVQDVLENQALIVLTLAESAADIPNKLINRALELGCHDDSTVIVIDIQAAEESPAEAERVEQVTLTMEVLRKIYLFQELALDELVQMVDCCSLISCQPGELLVEQGENGDSLFIILKGTFEVSRNGEPLSALGEGNHVGEMALLSGTPRAARVRALGPSKLLELKRDDFQVLIGQNPKMGVKLLMALAKELSTRLKRTNELVH